MCFPVVEGRALVTLAVVDGAEVIGKVDVNDAVTWVCVGLSRQPQNKPGVSQVV